MQKTKAKLPVFLILLTVTAVCVLRFFQLINDTDTQTGLIVSHSNISFVIYAVELLTILSAALYSKRKKGLIYAFDDNNSSKPLFLSAVLLSVSMFADFIHQCYNCYDYIYSVSFIEYTYLIPLALSGLFALLSSFYFLMLAVSLRRTNYDFRNFIWFHLVPVFWTFTKLFRIMVKILDIRIGVEACLEFLLIIFVFCFLFSFLSAVDDKRKGTSRFFVFSSVMLASASAELVIPRYIVFLCGKGSVLNETAYTSVTYIMLGLFALISLCDIIKRSNQKD